MGGGPGALERAPVGVHWGNVPGGGQWGRTQGSSEGLDIWTQPYGPILRPFLTHYINRKLMEVITGIMVYPKYQSIRDWCIQDWKEGKINVLLVIVGYIFANSTLHTNYSAWKNTNAHVWHLLRIRKWCGGQGGWPLGGVARKFCISWAESA